MDKTPISKSRSLSCRNRMAPIGGTSMLDIVNESNFFATKTPKASHDRDNEDSPLYFPNTQELNDEIDVVWDWNSPQQSEKKRLKKKRLLSTNSPKNLIKKHPSNSQLPNFEKLKEELQALREQLAVPDDEDSLCVSPMQENEFKTGPVVCGDLEDFFNDSVDEQLMLFSQKLENNLNAPPVKCNQSNLSNNPPSKGVFVTDMFDDSLDSALAAFREDDDFDIFEHKAATSTIMVNSNVDPVNLAQLENDHNSSNSGTVEFHRTKSFEMQMTKREWCDERCDQIEKNRLEAIARLESKRMRLTDKTKCSPEEIEEKRRQALAKLEAKRVQEMVEKNRQEALKRLQISKMKSSTLVKRL